ncbi:substrate-binding domain-containing protein [Streptomyces mirabilis]|uniref:substrate-binding domain-containing protein n=1 Tax=Streptomyces mirabilis TaxID=68239 RepID=UPI0021091235|nr:substrate-binding domain-containing protein [Streptomyces mirabilis]
MVLLVHIVLRAAWVLREGGAARQCRRGSRPLRVSGSGSRHQTPFAVPRPRAAGTTAVEAFRAAHQSVTAVAAFDDDVALRTLTALHDLGLTVPGDIAVIGFDDTEYGALITPALTTVHIDAEVPRTTGRSHRPRPRHGRHHPVPGAGAHPRLGLTRPAPEGRDLRGVGELGVGESAPPPVGADAPPVAAVGCFGSWLRVMRKIWCKSATR